MKKIKEMLIVFMFIISVSAVAAPQGHPLSDIMNGETPLTLGGLLTAQAGITSSTFVNANTITATGKVTAGSIEVGSVTLNSATLDMGTGKITNLGVPTDDTDAATVGYVNDKVSSVIASQWTSVIASQWTKTSNYLYYTSTNVGIGTTAPTAMLEIKSVKEGIGIVVDTSSQTNDFKYGLIVKATRDNTKAFAVTDGTSDKFVVYGSGKIVFPANKVYISDSIGCEYAENNCILTENLGKHSFCALGEYYNDKADLVRCNIVYSESDDKWTLKVEKVDPYDGIVSCKAYCI